jgi:RNA polymerase sigma-70 factor, ECF subfamily
MCLEIESTVRDRGSENFVLAEKDLAPLLMTCNCSQAPERPESERLGPEAPVESGIEMRISESVVLVDRGISVVWPRSSGEETGLATGIKRCAQRSDEKSERDPVWETGAKLIPLQQGKAEWRQQTLRLYDALTPRLTQFLRRLGLSQDEIDDVIQESFLRLAAHLREGNSESNLPSWVYRVARNLAMDVHRENQRGGEEVDLDIDSEDEPADPKANPEWGYLRKERFRQLRIAMARLTSQQYNSILLRTEGLRYREIAKLLGISEQRAIRLVKRGLQRIIGGM